MQHRALVAMLSVTLALLCGSASLAVPIEYGDFMADTVTFVDVKEDTNSGDTLPLFGAPNVSGNSIDFNPVGFGANASGAGGVDITDGNLFFMVQAKPQQTIQNLKLSEFGDTTLAGIGTDGTFTSVTTSVFINILEVDGVGINPINLGPVDLPFNFSPSGGTYGLLTDGGGGPIFSSPWMGMMFIDLHQELVDSGISFTQGITKITVNLDNTLTALSEAGTSSLIAKKDTTGIIVTVNIPEPATSILLLFVAAAGMLSLRRR